MNVFEWVYQTRVELHEAGEHRLADLLRSIPSLTCDGEHETLDAAIPEALALAKQQNNPWIELFVRHWNLQSRILHRMETRDWLPEAVDLLEYAHRQENLQCPQSICATQDLAVAYSQQDSEGYVEQRLAVASETLERITPRWDCFSCISTEYHNALVTAGRYEEALEFALTQYKAFLEANGPAANWGTSLEGAIYASKFRVGRVDEAIADARRLLVCHQKHDRPQKIHTVHLELVHYLCSKADEASVEEAKTLMPNWEDLQNTPSFYKDTAQALESLIKVGALENDWDLSQVFWFMADKLASQGVNSEAIFVAEKHAELALDRGQTYTARQSLVLIEEVAQKLLKPEKHLQKVSDLAAQCDALDASREWSSELASALQGTDPLKLIEALSGNPEADIAALLRGRDRFPESDHILTAIVQVQNVLGFTKKSLETLQDAFKDHPNLYRFMMLGKTYLDRNDAAALTAHFEPYVHQEDLMGSGAHWWKGCLARKQDAHKEAAASFQRVIALEPDHQIARTFAAEALRELGALEEALALLNEQIDLFHADEPDNADWDRMVLGTMLKNWEAVRASASRIGFQFETTEGPVLESGELCRIQFQNEPGAPVLVAQRESPVTARILELSNPSTRQHYHDRVVFEALPLNPPPEDHPEDEPYALVYKSIATLEEGGHRPTMTLDGIHPGDEALEALSEKLEALEVVFQSISGEQYRLPDPEGGENPVQGFYGGLGIPENVPLSEVHELLTEATRGFKHPLFWPGLLRTLGRDIELQEQREAMARYNIRED